MPTCPKCGKPSITDNFCTKCGTQMWAKCESCGASVNVDQKFCPNCGTRNKLVSS